MEQLLIAAIILESMVEKCNQPAQSEDLVATASSFSQPYFPGYWPHGTAARRS